jgi:hypothetical protein
MEPTLSPYEKILKHFFGEKIESFWVFFQEKTRHYEEEREKYKTEKSELRKRNLDEVETMRQDLIRMTNKVAGLQDEVRAKEELHLQLRFVTFTKFIHT